MPKKKRKQIRITFGDGVNDIGVVSNQTEPPAIVFKIGAHDPMPIGSNTLRGKSDAELLREADIVMFFKNEKSLDVLLYNLSKVKRRLIINEYFFNRVISQSD